MIEAKPAQTDFQTSENDEEVARLAQEVADFAEQIQQRLGAWRALLALMKEAGAGAWCSGAAARKP